MPTTKKPEPAGAGAGFGNNAHVNETSGANYTPAYSPLALLAEAQGAVAAALAAADRLAALIAKAVKP